MLLLLGAVAQLSAQERDKPTVGELIAAGQLGDLERAIQDGVPPDAGLMAAARNDSTAALDLLFRLGANPNGLHASRALFAAQSEGRDETAARLREAGVDLEGTDATGRTLLLFTVANAHADRIKAVLDAGVDIERGTHTGITPLMTAVISGQLKKARVLLARGADPDTRDRDGWTALAWAVRGSDLAGVRLLLNRGADPNTEDRLGWTPLHLAASQGEPDIVHELLTNGASPNYSTPSVGTPLIRAVLSDSVECVGQLLSFGANRWTAFGGRNPQSWARQLGRWRVVHALRTVRSGS